MCILLVTPAPLAEVEPAGHAVHVLAPAGLYVLLPHDMHDAELDAPVTLLLVPAGHKVAPVIYPPRQY